MNLSAPTLVVFLVSLALVILALIGHFTRIDFVTQYQFWIAIVAHAVLAFCACCSPGSSRAWLFDYRYRQLAAPLRL
jgi:hypothetical protein